MKKIVLYGLMACITWSMQSCLFSEDDLFEVSSAERENAAVEELSQVLVSSEGGWKLGYRYGGSSGDGGAVNIFLKFTDKEVEMASDFQTSSYTAGDVKTSRYSIQSYQGTMLTFDSYNPILHSFCQPNSYMDPGYEGDYEFIVRSVSENEIILTGKKYGVEMALTRLEPATDWEGYLTAAANIDVESDFTSFNMLVNGKNIGKIQRNGRTFILASQDEFGTVSYTYVPFIFTDKGMNLIRPLTVGEVMVQNFTWDFNSNSFICTDNGVDVKWVFERPAKYDMYVGKYNIQAGKQRIPVEIKVKKDGKSYQLVIPYSSWTMELELYYDTERDDISVAGQVAGYYNGFPVCLYPGSASGNFYADLNSVFEGHTVERDGSIEISFTNNPYTEGAGMYDWLFIYEDGGYRATAIWENPVFVKVSE